MKSFKERIRKQRFDKEVSVLPRDKPTPTLEDFPLPDSYEAWEVFEDMKFIHQQKVREYERQEKLALESFPKENKKVFPALLNCISDASIQDLRRSHEGAVYFNEHDAYSFFKLAIQEHDFLPPSMSSAAISRAKEDFEKMQQKPEDTLTEHINEFRRRLDNLLKIRGAEVGTPYADFDLRDLLIKSLYKPVWASWISSRKANANLPTTFEILVLALKQAESDMILEGPSIFDTFMPSAHATKRTPPTTTKSSSDSSKRSDSPTTAPSNCQCCGNTFYPKKAMHIRCDKCQVEFTAKRKNEKKKKIKGNGKATSSKPFGNSKAHSTTFSSESEDSESSDDEASPFDAIANYSSFFRTYAT